jgi:Glycosyl transferase family 2
MSSVAGSSDEKPCDPVDEAALLDFARRHGGPRLEPVTVVIPAYREARNIGAVLEKVPATLGGRGVSILVVVDGGRDGTEDVVARSGHLVCVCPVNRGQGAALRLGYRIAAAHGASYVVTLDADGQWDPADLETVLEPVVGGKADLSSGSRRTGAFKGGNWTRRVGVVVFSALISLLTRHRVTDPANGIRAMTATLPESLDLHENQYQSSELLVGAIMRGFHVTERPVTMRARASGSSKKGGNLRYGLSFARVVLKTWWRER